MWGIILRVFHEVLDNIGLHRLHKNRSIESQYRNDSKKISIDDFDKFYSAPKTPNIEFSEENKENNYGIGKFKFESEINNGISNKYSTGLYYTNEAIDSTDITNCIVIHGWRMDNLDIIYKMFSRNFISEGYNIYYYTLPYHFERVSNESMFNGELMVGSNIDRTLVSIRQAVSDVRALIYWLRKHKKGKIVVIGVSLGGVVSNLVGVTEKEIDGLVSLIYANSLAYSVWHTSPGKYIKEDCVNNNLTFDELKDCWKIIEPSNFLPLIHKDKILLMSGMYDKYVHIEDTSTLWEAWGMPKRLLYKCGHSGFIIKRAKIYKEVISFIKGL